MATWFLAEPSGGACTHILLNDCGHSSGSFGPMSVIPCLLLHGFSSHKGLIDPSEKKACN